jgi:group I intron endonuclease
MEIVTNGYNFKDSGIYLIRNNINNKFYIGSSSKLQRRYSVHKHRLVNREYNCNKILQNAVNKYGIENFTFEIIINVPPENLIEKEQFYLDLLKPHYNIAKQAGSNLGMSYGKEFSEKRRLYMTGRFVSEETRKKISKIHKGKKLSKELKEHLRNVNLGKKLSKETKLKISGSNHHCAKLSEVDIYFIREFIKAGYSNKQIGKFYNIKSYHVSHIKTYKIWKEVKL